LYLYFNLPRPPGAPGYTLRPCVAKLFRYRIVDACLHIDSVIAFQVCPECSGAFRG